MNIKVMYHTTTGNTRKISQAIASSVGVQAELIEENASFETPVDLLFIGDGLYGGKAHKSTIAFIDQLSPDTVKNAAVFGTYGGQPIIGDYIKKLLQDKGINVIDGQFGCKGKAWFFINRKHPDEADLNMAQEFAKTTLEKLI